jgi:Mn-dependent DtxR family transcriptional regulator
MRIVVEGETAEKLVQDLDGKEKYVSTLVPILEDVGWIEQEPSGKYITTNKGNSEAQMY